jgi:hypothetical protein
MRRSGLCFASGGDSVRAKSRARSDREQLGERGWHGERAGGGAQISQTARESEPDSRKKEKYERKDMAVRNDERISLPQVASQIKKIANHEISKRNPTVPGAPRHYPLPLGRGQAPPVLCYSTGRSSVVCDRVLQHSGGRPPFLRRSVQSPYF